MDVQIEFLSEPSRGRTVKITPAKPLVIKTQKSETGVGEVVIEITDGRVVLTNRSKMNCLVNGAAHKRTVLADRDRIAIGKQSFEISVSDSDPEDGTQKMDVLSEKDLAPLYCSVCDGPFKQRDHQHGWVRGEQRICYACLSKGVKPDHLPRRQTPPPMSMPEEAEVEEPETGKGSSGSRSAGGSRSESDRQRRTKRISVSRLAQVSSEPKAKRAGLLTKVGRMFGGREEANKLEALEKERRELLMQAGRFSLTSKNGPTMPDQSLSLLLSGQSVVLRLQDFSVPAMELWRAQRQRLSLLDAEIAALRQKLGLGPDPDLSLRTTTSLPSDRLAHQERTFSAMDEVGTESIDERQVAADEVMAKDDTTTAQPNRPRHSPGAGDSGARHRSKSSGRRRR